MCLYGNKFKVLKNNIMKVNDKVKINFDVHKDEEHTYSIQNGEVGKIVSKINGLLLIKFSNNRLIYVSYCGWNLTKI